jgi:serine/threonine protein phosphatase PrpC
MRIQAAARESTGDVHDVNQDAYCMKVAETDWGDVGLMVVCDGMGGLAKGELASATVVRAFGAWFDEELPKLVRKTAGDASALIAAARKAWPELIRMTDDRIAVYGMHERIDLGTTLSALLIMRGRYLIVQVGDSRIYRLSNGRATQLTADQTLVAHEVAAGRIPLSIARIHPQRNVLMQCIGCIDELRPRYRLGRVSGGEGFLLCSDGLCHEVTSLELYHMLNPAIVHGEGTMSDALGDLIMLARCRFEPDDITALCVQVRDDARHRKRRARKRAATREATEG